MFFRPSHQPFLPLSVFAPTGDFLHDHFAETVSAHLTAVDSGNNLLT